MRHLIKYGLAAVAAAAALVIVPAASGAGGTPAQPITFASSAQSSAHWSANHSGIDLNVGGDPSTAYAVATLRHFNQDLAAADPFMDVTNYGAGTPRLVIVLVDGSVIFGYPPEGPGNGVMTFEAFSLHPNQYVTWTTIEAWYPDGWIGSVYVVADGSMTVPYSTKVVALDFAGHDYIRG